MGCEWGKLVCGRDVSICEEPEFCFGCFRSLIQNVFRSTKSKVKATLPAISARDNETPKTTSHRLPGNGARATAFSHSGCSRPPLCLRVVPRPAVSSLDTCR